ncbi:centrosomal protein POC5 [Neosynchiropus ocellatus]
MSSDEEHVSGPVIPKSSGRSSVSSELQEEYEELLRYAVVTPKPDTFKGAHLQPPNTALLSGEGQSSQRTEHAKSHLPPDPEAEVEPGRPSTSAPSSGASPLFVPHSRASRAEQWLSRTAVRDLAISEARSDRLQTASVRSRSNSPDPPASAPTEVFICEEKINSMENILDMCSNHLKTNVILELRKWKLIFMEQHQQEIKKEKERQAAHTAGLRSENDSLKELIRTYETSAQRRDEVIVNLKQVLQKQKEKLETMKTFMQWRLKHTEAKEEAYALRVADKHYSMQLKRKVWLGWHSLIQKHWKVKVERACRARAEEVCTQLSTDYEAKLAEHCEALEKAHAEIQRLRLERERYEESMKKAFMRGVCALNMEALHMFNPTEGGPEAPDTESFPLRDETVSASRDSPVHFEPPVPLSHYDSDDMMGFGAPFSRAEGHPTTSVMHSSLPPGGSKSFSKQGAGRAAASSQQKPAKTITARVSARSDVGKNPRANLRVMGVAPPMTSVVVERHHPVTQLTIGQATAAKFPRSSQQVPGPSGVKASSRHGGGCQGHPIKVVD